MPDSKKGSDQIAKLKRNVVYSCEVKKPRNPKFHRKFFAIMNLVFENTEYWSTIDHLLLATKEFLGLCDLIKTFDGKYIRVPNKSISFEKMDDVEFDEKVYTPAVQEFARILGVDVATLEDESKQYM